ncbi:heme oxygenase [Algoriphagus ratkowskyi]|uniref:Heme oxygenase n=1 Tax=Algoriphagus ratkowskyi TaxID=57028 RepID=A0A2W7RRY1_9BACT|nr:biliverdin-producing heme oxygenase [Algoriphagus ratkowskyi]PZX61290.1 heme oxygenase [Algoriphagus ratkowskyi]TXD79402.1 biliverdin-producing heme oxygenase [Algoriphagus ratkowskyi]
MSEPHLSPSFLLQLKASTSKPHQELENLPISAALLSDDVSRENYILYLDLMYDAIREVEKTLFPVLKNEISDLDQRRKLPLLEKDFKNLGYTKDNVCPVFKALENEISIGFAMGMMYVIEGSSLGGRYIYKHIHKTLGYDLQTGASYFAGYSDQTGILWKQFMTAITNFEVQSQSGKDIIAGANYTFTAIKDHFINNSVR